MKKTALVLAIVFLLLQFSCSPSKSANFELYLTDAPANGLQHVYVTISEIYLRSEDRQSWTNNILTEPRTLDLLQLRGREEKLAALQLPEGTYSAIKMVITQVQIVTSERTFTIIMDPPVTVVIPVNFTVLPDGTVKITLDFDAERSLFWDGLQYNFRPTIIVKNVIHH